MGKPINLLSRNFSTIIIVYFMLGIFYGIIHATFYHWPLLHYLSPGFYVVVLSWPFQLLGFFYDFLVYGFAGKPLFL